MIKASENVQMPFIYLIELGVFTSHSNNGSNNRFFIDKVILNIFYSIMQI